MALAAETLLINRSILAVAVKYASVDHGHAHVGALRAVSEHGVIVVGGQVVDRMAIDQGKVRARPDGEAAAILSALRACAVLGGQRQKLGGYEAGRIARDPLVQDRRGLHLAQNVKAVVRSNAVGAERYVDACIQKLT